jgi:hypothetical protein
VPGRGGGGAENRRFRQLGLEGVLKG